ncbi:hypothetical protein [uncultured Psychroserpens sp.]|uniref:hypothetical protein n=1 Tax=uncultured Psychroserpens sp. TaxID=255436 RepID=UPI00263955B3|nr:hypothetical protein [uncultured Psychroserpens sp.]
MNKSILVFILSFILFSCKQEVKPTAENINAIINSNEYVITVDIVGGSVAGSFTDQMIIEIENNHVKSKSDYQSSLKELNNKESDSLKKILNNLVGLHIPEKIPLKSGGCTIHDENYTIENDSIRMKIKPHFNNSIYYEIVSLIK